MPDDVYPWFFEQHPDPLWVFDEATLRVLAVNDAACQAYGYSRDEFLALTIEDLRPPSQRPALRAALAAPATELGHPRQWLHRRKSGEQLYASVTGRRIMWQGRPARLVAARDVTAQVDLEQDNQALLVKAHEAEALLRVAGRVARLGSWRVNLHDSPVAVRWSDETARIHGEPAGFSPPVDQAIHYYVPEHRERIRQAFERCAEEGVAYDEALQIQTATGGRRWVRAIGEAERDASGKILAVHGAFQDITEWMSARQRSAELADRLEATLESISDAFFILDHAWCFQYLNRQGEQLLQRDRGELLGRNVWTEFPAAVGSQFQRAYEQARREQTTVRFIEYYEPLQTWFQVSAYPSPEGLAVYFRDVTQERANQHTLRLLEAAVARINDVVIITEAEPVTGPAGPRIVYVNEAFEHRTGYSREEAVGRTPRFLQGAETSRAELDRIRDALLAWQPVRAELVNYTRDGKAFWLELDIVPLADDAGRYTHWVSVERDITERKRTEDLVALHEERVRLVSQATHDVIWDWDLVRQRVWWNDAIQSLFGHDPDTLEPGPESWSRRIHPDDRNRVVDTIQRVIDGDGDDWMDEYRFARADGHWLTVIDRGFVLRDDEGRAVRMLGSMVDVTERRELDERLRQAQKLEAVGQLTGGVAHDFNNLLTVILGNTELLVDTLSPESSAHQLAEMTLMAAERGAELTSRLLAFARRQPLAPEVVDLNRLVMGLENLLRRTLQESVDIQMVREPGLWLTEIDPGQLEVAVLNLTINARDAMPQGGRLTVETANVVLDEDYAQEHNEVVAGEYVLLSVSDTGQGMAPDVVARAFDPFFTTKAPGKGSGMGLSMVYGFVKQSGGHAKIYSERGEGTTLRLYFPRAWAEETPIMSRRQASLPEGGSEHILVVEDDTLVRQNLIGQLRTLGYRVTSASSAAQALELLRGLHDVDLLFTDVVMPGGMNGPELAEEARALYPALKVLFTSGYTENAIVHHGRLDRGVHLLSKPYRKHEMATKVRQALDAG